MKNAIGLGIGIVLTGLAAACSGGPTSSGSSLVVSGVVAPGTRTLDDARAVAVAPDGTAVWSFVDGSGAFTLALPTGRTYRLLLANTLATGGQRVVGHLVVQTSHGPSSWIATTRGGTFALGTLTPSTTAVGVVIRSDAPEGSSGSSSGGASSDGSSGDDHSFDSHDDDHESSELCESSSDDTDESHKDVALHAQNDPGGDLADDHDKEDDDSEGGHTSATCGSGDGGAAASGGSSSSSGGTTGGAGGPQGSACTTNADCASPLFCIAASCQPAPK